MKNTFAVLAAGILLSTTCPAFAEPMAISRTAAVKYQSVTADETTESGIMTTLTIRGEQPIGKNLSIYARLAAQYASNPNFADYDTGIHGTDNKFVAQIDQFGVLYKPGDYSFNLGRQQAMIGKTALLYSRADTNVGYGKFVDGLSFEGKTGKFEVSGIAARENNIGMSNHDLFALRAGYNFTEETNAGVTWGKYQAFEVDTTNHWAIDASTKWGKLVVTGEYTQSSVEQNNKAYALNLNYDFDGKTAFYVTNFRVEESAAMGGQSDFDSDNRGFYYGLTHALNDKWSVEAIYKDQVTISTDKKNSKFELWLKHEF